MNFLLSELYIENLAVIKQAAIPIENGANIFTGETGAGKSILINGINGILGQRITKDIVRTGAKKATVTAYFRNVSENVNKKLEEFGFEFQEDGLALTREISADGGSTARINGRTASVAVLKELGEMLVNIHGQHDNQILLAPEKHISILDSFGELEKEISDYSESFRQLQLTAKKINRLKTDEATQNKRVAELTEIIEEISAVNPVEGEDEQIEADFELSQNCEEILSALNFGNQALFTDDDSVSSVTGRIIDGLTPFYELSEKIPELLKRLDSLKIDASDIAEEFNALSQKIDFDEAKLEYLSNRRQALKNLKRKYGPELSDVLKAYESACKELEQYTFSEDEIEKLSQEKQHLLGVVTEKAKKLSKHREKVAEKFITKVTEQLAFLDMPNVKLTVNIEHGKLTLSGMDMIEFLISANPGEPPKPIAKIASGGELSRIMLALKCVIADKDDIPTMIFDEIDTGVSGRAAQKIGIKLKELSKVRQVICVTHLSQIAVIADNHLLIEKNLVDDRTETAVKQLDFDGRKLEIARIIGGSDISEITLKTAEELIMAAK